MNWLLSQITEPNSATAFLIFKSHTQLILGGFFHRNATCVYQVAYRKHLFGLKRVVKSKLFGPNDLWEPIRHAVGARVQDQTGLGAKSSCSLFRNWIL